MREEMKNPKLEFSGNLIHNNVGGYYGGHRVDIERNTTDELSALRLTAKKQKAINLNVRAFLQTLLAKNKTLTLTEYNEAHGILTQIEEMHYD
jgi:hypothetical protein